LLRHFPLSNSGKRPIAGAFIRSLLNMEDSAGFLSFDCIAKYYFGIKKSTIKLNKRGYIHPSSNRDI